MLINQQKVTFIISVQTLDVVLSNLPRAIANKDGWRERERERERESNKSMLLARLDNDDDDDDLHMYQNFCYVSV